MAAASRTFASLAASLDGYIASASGDLTWLNDAMSRDEDYGMAETMARTGAYILGANTFREAAAMIASGGTDGPPTFVLTHALAKDAPPGVTFYSGELATLVSHAKDASEKDVHVFGGGDVVTQMLRAELLDELQLALIPVILGQGTRLFGHLDQQTHLRLADCRAYGSGIVLLRYERAASN